MKATPALTPAQRRSWAHWATRYASERWCWDDCADDIATRAQMAEERPDDFIDRMAAHWGLTDPSEPWAHPGYKPERVERIREAITERGLGK